MNHTCNSLFAEYHYMLIDLKEDNLSWKDLDSAGRARVHAIALEPSSIQSYALAVLTLMGDTALVNLPEYSEPPSGRWAEKGHKVIGKLKNQAIFSLFPNPNTGYFTLQMGVGSSAATKVTISDLTGRIVHVENISGKTSIVFNLAYLAKGMYFCSVFQAENRLGTQPLIINK